MAVRRRGVVVAEASAAYWAKAFDVPVGLVAGDQAVGVFANAETQQAAAHVDLEEFLARNRVVICDHCRSGIHGCSGDRCHCNCRKIVIHEELASPER